MLVVAERKLFIHIYIHSEWNVHNHILPQISSLQDFSSLFIYIVSSCTGYYSFINLGERREMAA